MNFLMINSINSYIKSIDLKSRWKQKKEKSDFSTDYTLNETQRKNEEFKKSYMEQKKNEDKDETLSSIYNKINMGSKLTPDEMKYLQTKNPTMYQKLKNIELEKKKYEDELKRCRTKEDVQKLKFSKISASMSAIKAVKDNPNIPESKKLEVASQEQRRLNELSKIEAKFVKSGEYAKLPSEAEKKKAENDIKKAEENQRDNSVRKPDNNSKAEVRKDPETEDENKSDTEVKAETVNSETKTVDEAEQTPEAKKVKRAKARKAYKAADSGENEFNAADLKKISV